MAKVGRPKMIKSPQVFDSIVDMFVENCKLEGDPLTVSGLCLFMGFRSKQTFYTYGDGEGHEEFRESVSRARMIVECGLEKKCSETGGTSGPQFLLRAVHNYDDKRTATVESLVVNIEGKFADV